MRLILFLAKQSRRTVVLAMIAGIVAGSSNTALLALINRVLTRGSTTRLAWSFVALCLALPLSTFVSESLLITLGQGALYDLRMELSRKILAVPLKNLEEIGAPRLLAALNEDVPTITNAVLLIPLLCVNSTIILGGLVYLGLLSLKLVLVVLVFMIFGVASYQLPVQRGMRPFAKAREAADALQVHFQGLTRGVKELKLHRNRRRAFLNDVMHETAGSLRTHNISGLRIFAAAGSWGQTIVIMVVGLAVFVLPSFNIVDAQLLTGYTIILLYLMTPIQVLITSLPTIGRAAVAINKIDALGLSLAASALDDDVSRTVEGSDAWQSLDLSGVTHSYHLEDSAFTLGPIDLRLSPGEVLFLVGGNGSGKTTLAKLLVGLYSPESGEVKLNGEAVTSETRDDYRQLFSAVFSDFFLFESLLGLETEGLDDRAREYVDSLQLTHKVKVNQGRLSTTELSAGQRKRLALLTAYLEDRPIYLFDEWAADQDPIFKDIFYYQIISGLRERAKTVIVISHDDRYYHLGDRIVKLENGRVEYDQCIVPRVAKSESATY